MAWSAPRTWSNGEIVTQTMLNTDVRDNMKMLWHEVAYVEFTSIVSSSSATLVDVVSAGAVTYGGFPIVIQFFSANITVDDSSSGSRLALIGDGVDLGSLFAVGGGGNTSFVERRLTPSAASHTYKIQIAGTSGGGTGTCAAGAGGAGTVLPGFIRILERGG